MNRSGALFDFDGTLTDRDTMAAFFFYCARKSPWRGLLMLMSITCIWPVLLFPKGLRIFNSAVLWWATVGLSRRATLYLIQDYTRKLIATPHLLLPGGLRRLEKHKSRAETVWIVSASCAQWIRPVLSAAGHGDIVVIGSVFAFCFGGLVMTQQCFGPEKVAAIHRRNEAYVWQWAYGDSISDLPVLRLAQRQGIIGHGRQAKAVQEQLGTSSQLLDWQD